MSMKTCPTCGHRFHVGRRCIQCFPNPEQVKRDTLLAQGLKECSRCTQILPLSEFGKRKERKSGYLSHCRKCATAQHKKWVEKNPDHVLGYIEQYKERKQALAQHRYQTNKQRMNAQSKRWKQLNPDKEREHRRKWMRANRDKTSAMTQRRRARKLSLPSTFTVQHWQAALAYWNGCCAYCGNQQGLFHHTALSMEHFIALSAPDCPGTTPSNMIPACLSCNSSRKGQKPSEWLESKFGKSHAKKTLDKIAAYFVSLVESN